MARATKNTRPTKKRRRFFNYPRSHIRGLRRWLPSWRVILGTMLLGMGVVAGVLAAAYYTTDAPSSKDVLDSVKNQTTTVYWGDGTTPLTTFAKDNQNREIIDYAELPGYVGNAVVASEDKTFWTNAGVDPKGIVRAFYNNLKGGQRQGGSTLTQQYIERYYTDTDTSYVGKLREAIMAYKVGKAQTKETILGNYLNTIYFGRGAYGIQAASKAYFGKDAVDLSISEAAMIAGIIPSPVRWDPAVNPDMAKQRWTRTLNAMVEEQYITAQDRAEMVFPTVVAKDTSNKLAGTDGYLIDMVEKELKSHDKTANYEVAGYTITTTINPTLQAAAVETMTSLLSTKGASPRLRGALVAVDPADGSIRAIYGGPDYLTQQFNDATQGSAQGGSTFKPFTLIGALEEGHSLTERYSGKNGLRLDSWGDKPVNNFGKVSYGRINLIKATEDSVNAVYAQLNDEIGPEKTVDVAHRLGIKSDIGANPSNVLGTDSVHPLELANAYATIAARGTRFDAHIVATVKDKNGKIVWQAPTTGKKDFADDVMDGATYAMTQVVQKGSGETARELDRPVAGKTGSSNENKSAWFAGFVPQLATVVGLYQDTEPDADGKVGQASITPFGGEKEITGGTLPTRAWTDFMKKAVADLPVERFHKYTPPKDHEEDEETPTPSPTQTLPTDQDTAPTMEVPEQNSRSVYVENMIGYTSDSVIAALQAKGLYVQTNPVYSDYPEGTVVNLSDVGPVPPGTTIVVDVSMGPEPDGNQGNGNGNNWNGNQGQGQGRQDQGANAGTQ